MLLCGGSLALAGNPRGSDSETIGTWIERFALLLRDCRGSDEIGVERGGNRLGPAVQQRVLIGQELVPYLPRVLSDQFHQCGFVQFVEGVLQGRDVAMRRVDHCVGIGVVAPYPAGHAQRDHGAQGSSGE